MKTAAESLFLFAVAAATFAASAAAQTPFSAAAAPNPATLQAGGGAVPVTVATTVTSADFREPILYSFSGFPAGIATGAPQTVPAPYGNATFAFSAAAGVAPGTYHGVLTGRTSAATITVNMTVVVHRPDYTIAAAPVALVLLPGETRSVTVAAAGSGGFSGSVAVSAAPPAGITVEPASFSLTTGGDRTVAVRASESAAAGTVAITFTGNVPGIGARTASVGVTIRPPPPVIESVTPSAVVAGAQGTILRVTGRHFQPSAAITSPDPALQVHLARVISATAAEVVVSARPTAAGAYRLELVNPDGAAAAGGATVRVQPAAALSAPFAVTAVRIVSPRQWQLVAENESVHAHALLATSGVGSVVGTWLLDGVPFERFTRMASGGAPIEVRSTMPLPTSNTGEHRLELVLESPATLPPQGVSFIQATERRSALRVLAPDTGGAINRDAPLFRWSIVPGASGYEIEVRHRARAGGEDAPWTHVRRRVTDTEWQPEPELRAVLDDADAGFRVRAVFPGDAFGEPTPWRAFRFAAREPPPEEGESPHDPNGAGPAGDARGAPVASRGEAEPAPATRQLDLSVGSTTTATGSNPGGPPALTRLQLSTQADIRDGSHRHQVAGDFAVRHDLGDPWRAHADNRHWVGKFGFAHPDVMPAVTVGFAPPSFLDQSELLTVFSAGGGVQGTVGTSVGRGSVYRSARLTSSPESAVEEPGVTAAAYELFTADGRYLVRGTTLLVEERPVDEFGRDGDGTAVGFLAAADFGPRLHLIGEAAFGDYRPRGDFDEARSGNAIRAAARGGGGSFAYAVGVSHTESGFVNPANPGFTPAGLSGRTRAEVTVGNTFGRTALNASLTHVRGGVAESIADPRTRENGGRLMLSMPVTQRVTIALGGNVHAQSGRAIEELGVPATDRSGRGIEASANGVFGRFGVSQSVSWQDFSDRVNGEFDQTVLNIALGANGAVHDHITVAANISETHVDGGAVAGLTRHRLLALQPVVSVWSARLRFQPRVALNRSTNDVMDSDIRSLHYQFAARLAAPWSVVPLALEVASDWSRQWSGRDEVVPGFEQRTLITLSLDWRADRAW